MLLESDEITKRLFIWGVLAIAIIPRHHVDRSSCSIGGDVSLKFKELLLFLVFLNLIRLFVSGKETPFTYHLIASDVLGIVEVVGLSFLCFLSPYLLQLWLVGRVNLPGGRAGADLIRPLYGACFLSFAGVLLSRTVNPNFWSLKKIANAISTPPVLRTLRLFNLVTTRGGHHDGRGTIISQSLAVVEYWHVAMQLLCALGYAFDQHTTGNWSQLDHVLSSFRAISFVSDWMRVCAHAIFINQLDELFLISPPSDDEPDEAGSNEDPGILVPDSGLALVRRQVHA